jgi:hypothetical protein
MKGLTEWQMATTDKLGDRLIALDVKSLQDILANAPSWGFLSTLDKQELKKHFIQLDQSTKSNPKETARLTVPEVLPFPFGPAPILKRTNPSTQKREAILFHSVTQKLKYMSYLTTEEQKRRREWSMLRDQPLAEVILRMYPAFFMALYEHKKKEWKSKDNANENHFGSCLFQEGISSETIRFGGVKLCTPSLLSALAHSYTNGSYQKLQMQQILCWNSTRLCGEKKCLRHCILESNKATMQRWGCRGMIQAQNGTIFRDCTHKPCCLRITKAKAKTSAVSWVSVEESKENSTEVSKKNSDGTSPSTLTPQSQASKGDSEIRWVQRNGKKTSGTRKTCHADQDTDTPLVQPYRNPTVCSSSSPASLKSGPKQFWENSYRLGSPVLQCSDGFAKPSACRKDQPEVCRVVSIGLSANADPSPSLHQGGTTPKNEDRQEADKGYNLGFGAQSWHSESTVQVSQHTPKEDRYRDNCPLSTTKEEREAASTVSGSPVSVAELAE